jgi:uncharacterized protein YeaC (DUF1315 family)
MHIEDVLKIMTPDLYQRFKRAIELGKWPDGTRLSQEQLATCMQSVIAYELQNLPPEKRTGYVPPKATACDTDADSSQDPDEPQPLNWQ